MTGSIYEGYKDALRRGHVAALRGRLEAALAAYREAARIAPDRALPYVGLGGVLARLERIDEALAAYRTALDRSPDDEGALRGRADLLAAAGRPAEAAISLDRLAGVLEGAGRIADACDVARRALELAESRGRRRLVQTLAGRLRETSGDPSAADALARAMSVLEIDPVAAPVTVPAGAGTPPTGPGADEPAPVANVAPPPDPAVLARAFEMAIDAGDFDGARKHAVAAASAHRTVGQFHAAIDACYDALAIAPADPGVHFVLAQLYLDRGWRTLAADKLVLIGRLAQLTGDSATRARLCDLAARRFPEDARLTALCA
jgi:tetratricopeptide (TPR) repeat protein